MSQIVNDSQFAREQAALALWEIDKVAFSRSQDSATALGSALNKVAENCAHGEFGKWLKNCIIPRNRATYCMRLANGKAAKAAAKPKVERFVLEGLTKYSRQKLEELALQNKVTLAAYVRGILEAHITSESRKQTESDRAHDYEKSVKAEAERLRRIPLLGGEVIYALDWKERTEERVRRLMSVAQPPRSKGVGFFVDLFEQTYGTDLTPLSFISN